MRKLKDWLRFKFVCGLSHAQIGRALGLSKGVITKYLQPAHHVGLNWEPAAGLDEALIAERLSRVHPRHRCPRVSCRTGVTWLDYPGHTTSSEIIERKRGLVLR